MRTSNIVAGVSNSGPAKFLSHRERLQMVALNISQLKMDIYLYIHGREIDIVTHIYIYTKSQTMELIAKYN